jgi:hypothetical protein
MRKPLTLLGLAYLLGAIVVLVPTGEATAKVWRDCQRIARCHGCTPVYRCRSCEYQRQCRYGQCQWGDVCVWGPYIPLAPRGVPVY